MTARPDCRHCLGRGWCPSLDVHPREYACGCSAPVCIGCGATVPREGDECGRPECPGYDDRPADSIEAALLARVSSRPKRAPYGVIPALGRVDVEPCS